MNWLKKFFAALAGIFTSPRAKKAAELTLKYVVEAMPLIDLAATIVTTLTPTGIDDAFWSLLHVRYPRLFDGSIKTSEELKLYALAIAAELLREKFPVLDTTTARLAVQSAFLERRDAVAMVPIG
jgi:hypothetical protein